jgi:hypothetical protein
MRAREHDRMTSELIDAEQLSAKKLGLGVGASFNHDRENAITAGGAQEGG